MIICTEQTLVKETSTRYEATPLYCRSWHCEVCRPKRKWRLINDLEEGRPNTFLTLTVNAELPGTPEDRFIALREAWKRLLKRLYRANGGDDVRLETRGGKACFPYHVIVEKTEAGEAHLHVLCRSLWIGQEWLAQQMDELLSSPVVDIRRIRHRKQIARYVSKYVGKKPGQFGRSKRYWKSRTYCIAPVDKPRQEREEGTVFRRVKMTLQDYFMLWSYTSLSVVKADGKVIVFRRC